MDRILTGKHSPKSRQPVEQPSAFEMSLRPEFAVNPTQNGFLAPKAGDTCPNCQSAKLDYDCMLNLSCQECNFSLAGCFT